MNYEQSLSRFVDAVKANPSDDDKNTQLNGRLSPYRVNRRASALMVLRNNFPTVQALLGERIFSALSQVYANVFPSSWWDINVFGAEFPGFLKAQVNSPKGQEFNWLKIAEIAELEYAIIDRYYYPGHATTEELTIDFQHFDFEAQGMICSHHPQLVVSYNFQKSNPEFSKVLPNGIASCKDINRLIGSGAITSTEKLVYLSANLFRENFQVMSVFSCTTANL